MKDKRVISQEAYDSVKPLPEKGEFFQNFAGVYCKNCGETFALYSYSVFKPHGVDENNKPFYKNCVMCGNE